MNFSYNIPILSEDLRFFFNLNFNSIFCIVFSGVVGVL